VSRENHVAPIALAAALLLRLGLTDAHLNYVKPAMRPWLVVSGAVLAVLAVVRYLGWRSGRTTPAGTDGPDGADHDHSDEHDHADDGPGHGRGVLPWMLALPFAAVILVTPAPLASFAASRQEARAPAPSDTASDWPPLASPVDGAYEMDLSEFVGRAAYDGERQLEGRTVRLTGFVSPPEDGAGQFTLTRFQIACCAGDGYPIKVAVDGLEQPVPSTDTWLVVEGVWDPASGDEQPDIPVLDATTIREIPQPSDPYEN
jgi:uncharacterized repeat protein (TIGR03943 family)